MKVKVCGITNYEDAAAALDLGVDALGFNFYPKSPRYIDPVSANAIIRRLPPFVATVGVFVNAGRPTDVELTAGAAGIQIIQLHGNETASFCSSLERRPLIKAVRIASDGSFEEKLDEYPVQAFLLDSRDDTLFGGTGKTIDWERAKAVRFIRPIILAGGLRPDNVAAAIRTVMPYAVDVCSGVERAPGKKDAVKLNEFMREVRNAGQ